MATFKNKLRLLRGLLSGTAARSAPAFVTVDITNRCNLNCLCCRYHSPVLKSHSTGEDMPLGLFKDLCLELKEMETELVILEGEGEPFLHPEIEEFISTVTELGFESMIFTNGTLLDESSCERLAESRVGKLRVSLWAADSEEYASNHPGTSPEVFDGIVENLRRMAEIKERARGDFPKVEICFPVHRENYHRIDSTIELAHAARCDGIYFSRLSPYRGAFSDYVVPAEEREMVRTAAQKAAERLESLEIRHNIGEFLRLFSVDQAEWLNLPCYIGWYHARIKADGSVRACNLTGLSMGSLKERGFREIWNGTPFREFREKSMRPGNQIFKEKHCDFDCCIHTVDNKRVHDVFRWFTPFVSWKKKFR